MRRKRLGRRLRPGPPEFILVALVLFTVTTGAMFFVTPAERVGTSDRARHGYETTTLPPTPSLQDILNSLEIGFEYAESDMPLAGLTSRGLSEAVGFNVMTGEIAQRSRANGYTGLEMVPASTFDFMRGRARFRLKAVSPDTALDIGSLVNDALALRYGLNRPWLSWQLPGMLTTRSLRGGLFALAWIFTLAFCVRIYPAWKMSEQKVAVHR